MVKNLNAIHESQNGETHSYTRTPLTHSTMCHAPNHLQLLNFIFARHTMADLNNSWRVCLRENEQKKTIRDENGRNVSLKITPPGNRIQHEPTLTKAPLQLCTARHSPADKHRWRWLIVVFSSQDMRELIITAIIQCRTAVCSLKRE